MRRASRTDRILDAGATLLFDKGYRGCTMRDVARAAGTSVSNLYHYAPSKEDLVFQVHRRILGAAVASAQAALVARDRLRAVVTDHVRRVLARPAEAEVLRGAALPLRAERARVLEELRRRYHARVRAAAEAAVRRRLRPAEADALVAMLLGMADRVALDAVRQRSSASPDRLARRVLGLFLEGARRSRA